VRGMRRRKIFIFIDFFELRGKKRKIFLVMGERVYIDWVDEDRKIIDMREIEISPEILSFLFPSP
jgi:hypothetical protein